MFHDRDIVRFDRNCIAMARRGPLIFFVAVVVVYQCRCVSAMTPGTLRHQMQTAFARNKLLLPSKHWNQMVGNVSEQCKHSYINLPKSLWNKCEYCAKFEVRIYL